MMMEGRFGFSKWWQSGLLRTTAVRLSALYILLFGLVAAGLALYMMQMSVAMLSGQTLQALNQEIASIEASYQRGGIVLLVRTIDRRSRQPGAFLYLIADEQGRTLAGNVRNIEPGLLTNASSEGKIISYSRLEEGAEPRPHKAMSMVINLPNRMKLMVGRDMGDPEASVEVIRKAFMIAFAMMVLGAILIWLLIGRRALQRIDNITKASKSLMGGDLSGRLPETGNGDEFDRLSHNLNVMLEKIEDLNSGLREVSDNIAHDLRTPLTRLRAHAEDALKGKDKVDDYREALSCVITESDQLITLFNAILMISRIEAGTQPAPLNLQNLRPIVEDAVEFYAPMAEESGVNLTIDTIFDVEICLNRELIAQTLFNLLDNALKYAPCGQDPVEVRVAMQRTQGGQLWLLVADNGEGIAHDERGNVLKRFYRLEASRTKPGSGIGLSLSAAVMKLHGGQLILEDNTPTGLRVILAFTL